MTAESTLLVTFKKKIEEAVALVPGMVPEEKLKAVQFWNVISERLQEIVNNSAADISALAYEMEKKNGSLSNGESQTPIGTPEEPHELLIQGASTNSPEMVSYKLDMEDRTPPVPPKSALSSLTENHQTSISSFPSSDETSLAASNEQILPSSTEHPILSELLDGHIQLREQMPSDEPVPIAIEKGASIKNVPKLKKNKISSGNDGTWNKNDGNWKVILGKTQLNTGSSVRRQPPRSKRRKKNFALAHADSENSNDEMDSVASKLIDRADSAVKSERDDDLENSLDENGSSGIILMNAKSLKGTSEDECFEDGGDGDVMDDELKDELADDEQCQSKPYSCSECRARFSTKGNLVVHVRRHTGEKPFNCSQCKAKFSTKGNLKRHIKTHSGERPWECEQCGGRFTEKKSLKVHMRRHTGEKPYACSVCGKQFAQTGILQTHMAMHLDQKEHLCEHCGKSFRQKSQLRLHMMRHEGVRKYQCPACPSKFLTKGDLERHNRTHTGERPFVCEICGKTFTRQQSLNEHMNRHYGLKPYECKYCNKGFAEMSACYKHIKQHERYDAEQLSNDGISRKQREPFEADQLSNDSDEQQHMSVTALSCDARKYTVLVQTGETLDVATCNEISLVEDDQTSAIHEETANDNIGDFTAINLLATASSFQQNY